VCICCVEAAPQGLEKLRHFTSEVRVGQSINVNGVLYVPLDESWAQRCDVAEKFIAEAQALIHAGNNAGRVLRKLQAARNVLTGRVADPEQALAAIANEPVRSNGFVESDPALDER
jgi:hypothetical protein